VNPHDRFSDSWLLDRLGDDERDVASGIIARNEPSFWPAETRRIAGDLAPAECLLVESGFLVVRASSSAARPVVVAEAGAGSTVPTPSDREHIHALTDCRVTMLRVDQLDDLLAMPSTASALFRSLMSALRVRQEAARYYGSVRHVDRVRAKLLQLGREFGRVTPTGIRVEFPLTHHLLADMIASARETVTRCLDQLHRDGFLVRDGHSYTLLLSPEALDASD
jgi:CRP-like cAMP-binding protein